jgi:hypothetical protein
MKNNAQHLIPECILTGSEPSLVLNENQERYISVSTFTNNLWTSQQKLSEKSVVSLSVFIRLLYI